MMRIIGKQCDFTRENYEMKLLIAEDEKLTREGIISSIDWPSLGVSEIFQADDGIHGLEIAQAVEPDIVLSDVRMPRLDGIEMSMELKKLFPDINIILMSGYSDKAYLKAAIKLKAISYVEKPIDPEEIREAVLEALKNKQTVKETTDVKKEHHSLAASSLAARLIYPGTATEEELADHFRKLSLKIDKNTHFYTMIFSFKNALTQIPRQTLDSFYQQLHDSIRDSGLEEIHGIKQERFIICHIFGTVPSTDRLKLLASELAGKAQLLSSDFFLVIGKRVCKVTELYESYNSAVIELQSCFYHPYGSWFISEIHEANSISSTDTPVSMDQFRDLLNQTDKKIFDFTSDFYETLLKGKNILPNQVKNMYYQMLSAIQEAYHLLQLPLPENKHSSADVFEIILNCGTIFELHEMLHQELELFLAQADLSSLESAPITAIKNFIAAHYQDETLSIKDISEHVFLSTSYICTIFKTETGQTLNQYITKYRVEKAKKLLADPRNKISDISSKVGYNDGNYFGKTFKKIVGLSPTEYRDQVTGL